MADQYSTLLDFGQRRDRPAVFADERWFTYGEIADRAAVIASRLMRHGLKRGDRFAFFLPNTVNILGCYIACAMTGMVGVPVSQRATPNELAYQLEDSGALLLLFDDAYTAIVSERRESFPPSVVVENIEAPYDPRDLPKIYRRDDQSWAKGEDAFCVIYTGGTTGVSKAAVQTRDGWMCCLDSSIAAWGLTDTDITLVALPMSHAAWFTAGATLSAGGKVILQRNWDPSVTLDLIGKHQVTTINMIPTMLGDLLGAYETERGNMQSLRLLTVAGSALPIAVYQRACDAFGDIVGNIYGLTEAAGPVTFLLPSEMRAGKFESVGRPGKHIEIAILDDNGKQTEGAGEIGVGGKQVMAGYFGRPEETKKAFAGRWLLTGDIGTIDADGFLYIVDRKKDMVKTGGFNVYPSEVEQVLYRRPGILECVVFGVPDSKWSEAVHAVVSLKTGACETESEIIRACRSELAGYKVPKRIHIVDGLPRTKFGKIDRARVKQELLNLLTRL